MTVAAFFPTGARKTRRPNTRKLDISRRNLIDEARARIGLRGSIRATRRGIGEKQALARTRDGDVGQTTLLVSKAPSKSMWYGMMI